MYSVHVVIVWLIYDLMRISKYLVMETDMLNATGRLYFDLNV